jgi:hypothetical protein
LAFHIVIRCSCVASVLVVRPVSFLAVSFAVEDFFALCTSGKLRVCFQFSTTLTSNDLARFLVLGPVRFLALDIAIKYSFVARTLQALDLRIAPATVLTLHAQQIVSGEASSRRPRIIDFCNTLVGNEPTFVLRANWNTSDRFCKRFYCYNDSGY